MGMVMIACPVTGREVPTGMTADRAAFMATVVFFGRTLCPHCGITHEWFAKDAWVRESGVRSADNVASGFANQRTPEALNS